MPEVPFVPFQGIVGGVHDAAIAGRDARGVSWLPAGRGLASVNAGPTAARSCAGSFRQVSLNRGPAVCKGVYDNTGVVWPGEKELQENTSQVTGQVIILLQ